MLYNCIGRYIIFVKNALKFKIIIVAFNIGRLKKKIRKSRFQVPRVWCL